MDRLTKNAVLALLTIAYLLLAWSVLAGPSGPRPGLAAIVLLLPASALGGWVLGRKFAPQVERPREPRVLEQPPLPPQTNPRWRHDVFDTLIAACPVAIAVGDRNHRVQLSNAAFHEVFGYSEQECSGSTIEELIVPPEERQGFRENAVQVLAGGSVHKISRRRRKDGSLVPVETFAVPLMENGMPTGVFAMYLDITKRVEAEEALRRREEVFRMLSATAPVGIFQTDETGRPIYVNARLTELTGITFEQSTSNRWSESLHPEDRDRALRLWLQAIHSGGELVDQHRIIRHDGKVVWVAVRARWAKGDKGELHSFVGVVEDITQLREAHERMREAKETAEAASFAKSEFLANMSHEIRTPLNGIVGMTDLALGTELTAEQREYLETVKLSSDSLLAVINDILDFSKIEAGKLEIETIDFNLHECVRGVAKTLEVKAREKQIDLLSDLSPNLPEVVRGDPTRLRQVLLNLVGNAIKFTSEGRVVIGAKAEFQDDSHHIIHFCVSDTGIGIPANKLAAIFEPFSQADSSTTRRFGGTGLGLTISARLVEIMGGRIWVESEVGRGARFHFTALLGAASVNVYTASLIVAPAAGHAIDDSRLRVLLAEDNPVNQKLAIHLLEKRGHTVVAASNGREAVKAIREREFDLALMDVQMPEMDGLEAVAEIRKLEKESGAHLHVVALTAHASKGDRERCLAAGMDSYLTKPLRPEELDEVLRRIAQGKCKPGSRRHQPSPVKRASATQGSKG